MSKKTFKAPTLRQTLGALLVTGALGASFYYYNRRPRFAEGIPRSAVPRPPTLDEVLEDEFHRRQEPLRQRLHHYKGGQPFNIYNEQLPSALTSSGERIYGQLYED